MRALIVDDSRFIREYLRQLLEESGLSCQEAGAGPEALQLLRDSTPFDSMLLDVNMPQMSGLDCVKAVRDAGLHPPLNRALEHGADEFLMKPFTPDSLREKLMMLGLAA
jgi:two-component system chemotaxis response regulator CheY